MQPPRLIRLFGFACLTTLLAAPAAPGAQPGDSRAGAARAAASAQVNVTLQWPSDEARPQPDASAGPARGIRTYGAVPVEVAGAAAGSRPAAEPADEGWDEASLPDVAALGVTAKLSGAPMAGSVTAFRVSPDGGTVVFIADKETLGRFELYSVPVNGSAAPVKLSAGLPFGTGDKGVSTFQITPDGTQVVFLADPNTGNGLNEIFSAPINASAAPVRLNVGNEDPISALGITPNGAWAVFLGVDTASASGAAELFRAAIGSASSAVQLSDTGLGNALGDVVAADFSPDSARVVYATDAAADNVYQWHSVPLGAAGPGSDVALSAALGSVSLLAITPDSTRVIYAGDENVLNRQEIFSRPIAGGARVQLNPAMAGDGVTSLRISADGGRVVYLADQTTAGVLEVYSAQPLVAASGIRLNTPMAGTQYADSVHAGPDAATAVFEADQDTPGTHEVFKVPMNGSAVPVKLHDLTAPDSAGAFEGLGTPILSRRAVYPVFGLSVVNLFSVPYDGSGPFEQVNDPLAAGETLLNVYLPASGRRLMAWGAGPSTGSATRKLFAGPLRSDLPVEQINTTAVAGALGVLGYEINATETYGVYIQDKDTSGKPELFSYQLDSDADGVINASDNCAFLANPSQTPVVFPATVQALNNTTFSWETRLDARFARGPLGPALATNATGTLIESSGYTDAAAPAAGSGWYYLFAPDCPGRSYQTSIGAQPGRDLAGLP